MRAVPAFLFCAALGIAAVACDRRDLAENQPKPEPRAAQSTDAAKPAPGNNTASETSDSLALGLLGALNEHEIAAAKQAESKGVSAPVMAYAKMMETQHGENQTKTQALGPLADTAEVKAMKDKGESDLAELGKKNGKTYEKAYVDAMVKGHTEALALIDTRLIVLSSSPNVKAHMTDTRDHVAQHLEAAKKLQASQ